VSADQAGKANIAEYLSAFKQYAPTCPNGQTWIGLYEIVDDSTGTWGFFNSSYGAKNAATYLHNLTTFLADTASFTPGSLNYSISGEPSTVHDLLLQKSNGHFELIIWDDRLAGASAENVSISLGGTHTVTEFDVVSGATTSLGAVSSVTISTTDHAYYWIFYEGG
jgi:hypothetical protein